MGAYDAAKKRAYYEANREAKLAYQAKRRQDPAYQAAMAVYRANWAAANPDKVQASRRKWYENNYQPPTDVPVPDYWPYNQSSPLIDRVNAVVSKYIPDDLRADICQELCLLVIKGELEEAEIASAIPHVRYTITGKQCVSLGALPEDSNVFAIEEYV